MVEEYSQEHLWKLYEVLPKELQEAIFSVHTADTISEIGKRNNLKESQISEIAKYVGYTLLGILPPEDFLQVIKDKINLSDEEAKKINNEIYRFIFFPLKNILELIYGQKEGVEKKESKEKVFKTKEVKEKSKDVYREPID